MSFNRPCAYCKRDHNRALCENRYEIKSSLFPNSSASYNIPNKTIPNSFNKPKTSANFNDEYLVEDKTEEIVSHINNGGVKNQTVSLLMAKCLISNFDNPEISTYAHLFFDSGSQRSYITKDLQNRLGLKSQFEEFLNINTFGPKTPTPVLTQSVIFGIILDDESVKPIEASSVDHLTNKINHACLSNEDINFIYIILPSGTNLIYTRLGYLYSGAQFSNSTVSLIDNLDDYVFTTDDDILFEETLSKDFTPKILETFWDLETIGIKETPYENDDDLALQHFNSTIKF